MKAQECEQRIRPQWVWNGRKVLESVDSVKVLH
jgi:hypothetical protein